MRRREAAMSRNHAQVRDWFGGERRYRYRFSDNLGLISVERVTSSDTSAY